MRAQPESMAAGHISVVMWIAVAPLPKPVFFETLAANGSGQGKLKA
jgi:hypothetical protein